MKKLILIIIAVSMISGCGRFDRWLAGTTGKPSEICVDNVTYLQFTSGVTVKVDQNGKPIACK